MTTLKGLKMDKLPLRPNVCMLLVNNARKVFLGERFGEPGVWQFPQGGAEPELSEEENVLKELNEELGIKIEQLRILKKLSATHEYDFSIVPEYAKGKWRGQKQTFWLVEFLGSDSEINLVSHEQEFSKHQWCSFAEVLELAEPKRVAGYCAPLAEVEKYFLR